MTALSGTPVALSFGPYAAEIVSVGASLRVLTHDGRDLVRPFDAAQVRPSFAGAVLAPWPNRVVDGSYTWDGTDHQLALTEPTRGHALHGLVAWANFAVVEQSDSHVLFATEVPAQDGYPFPLRVTAGYELGDNGLTCWIETRNVGDVDAPYGTGPHPYLVAGPGTVDEWTLTLPADTVATITEPRLLPAGDVSVEGGEFDFREARVIESTFIDHAFTGLSRDGNGFATVLVTAADGSGVGMAWDQACPWVQIHTADGTGRTGLAVEPMTCPPDAFSTGTDVIRLAAGTSHTAGWRIFAV